ncbi:MAG TPA: antibiotic biosynthesis monooxygenase family protein [Actinomycetota bacterium]|nr:antibiotic biosynthesis monooxygenase family protein [Actinomycetota bacterium]
MAIFVYLRFSLDEGFDRQDFEGDMRAMAELAREQPGHRWSEMGRSMADPSVYVVVSEWDDVDQVRAWEHQPVHVQVQQKWESRFREPLLHRRFVPWERPPET